MATKVYTYGAFPNIKLGNDIDQDSIRIIHDQVFKAHLLKNKLIELERIRRENFSNLRKKLSPKLESLQGELDILNDQCDKLYIKIGKIPKSERKNCSEREELNKIKNKRSKLFNEIDKEYEKIAKTLFDKPNKELAKRKKKYEAKIGPVGPRIKEKIYRQIISEMVSESKWPDVWKELKLFELDISDKKKKAYAKDNSGCYTGTYQAVLEATKRSFKTPGVPKYKRFDGHGKVGIQVTKPTTFYDCLSLNNDAIKIQILPETKVRGFNKQKNQAAIATIKLAGRKNDGVYIKVPFIMHRPLPVDAKITWVYLVVNRVGINFKYDLQFTVNENNVIKTPAKRKKKKLAIQFGWRLIKNKGVRVATTWDDSVSNEIILPLDMRDIYLKSDRLLGYSDDYFNGVCAVFKEWMTDNKLSKPVREKFKLNTIDKWKSHGRLAILAKHFASEYLDNATISRLWHEWRVERIGYTKKEIRENPRLKNNKLKKDLFAEPNEKGEPRPAFEIYKELDEWFLSKGVSDPYQRIALYLEWWRRKDEHLINMARNLDLKVRLRRREVYRVCASNWVKQYDLIITNKWNKSKTAETPSVENDTRTKQEEHSNSLRFFAGISFFTSALKESFGKDNFKELETAGKNFSKTHFKCGGEGQHTMKSSHVQCNKCKKLFDQDFNHVQHLYFSKLK